MRDDGRPFLVVPRSFERALEEIGPRYPVTLFAAGTVPDRWDDKSMDAGLVRHVS